MATATSLVTTTRASPATYFDASGVMRAAANNVLRLDHDPVSKAAKGALIEGSATNLLSWSEEFDNGAWSKVRSAITANAVVAPDGAMAMDKLVEDASPSTTHFVAQTRAITAGSASTASVVLKAAERSFAHVALLNPSAPFEALRLPVNLIDGSVGQLIQANGASAGTYNVEKLGDDRWRVSVSGVIGGATTAQVVVFIAAGLAGSGNTYTGDGVSGLYIWGAQLEAGAFPTSFIKTTSAAATRSADTVSIPTSAFPYNVAEGTIYADFAIPAGLSSGGQMLCELNDGTYSNRIYVYRSPAGNLTANVVTGGVMVATVAMGDLASLVPGSGHRIAFAFAADDFAASINGAGPQTDKSGVMPLGIGRLSIGARITDLLWGGHIKRVVYHPRRISNAELQAMTVR